MLNSNIEFWQQKLKELKEIELPEAIRRLNRVRVNDWYQNAEFEDSERHILIIQARIDEIKQLIRNLSLKKKN